jgi:hypothetical protein
MTTKYVRGSYKSAQFTGFEPGVRIEERVETRAPAPLESAPGTDHFAAFEARRTEMLNDTYARLNALRAKPAELKKRAAEMRQERDKLLMTGGHVRAEQLHADAARLEEEARLILRNEIPALEFEAMQVASSSHPTLVGLRICAEGRVAADKRHRAAPQELPNFVVLDKDFGWTENSIPTTFRAGQMVRDPALISKLIEYGAPLAK